MSYPYPLVVFDLDGTLVDSAADIAEALNRTLQDWQLPRVPEATVLTWIGDGVRRLVEQAFTAAGSDIDLDEVMPVSCGTTKRACCAARACSMA